MPAGIQITHVGRQKRDGIVGQLLPESLAFKVTENGKPVADEWITVDSDPEGAGVFPPSDESYASIQTDKAGIARVQFRPSRDDDFTIRATARGETKGVYRMSVQRNARPQMLGPNIVDARRGHSRNGGNYAWPIVAGLAAVLVAALVWKGLDKPSAPGPYPYPVPSTSTVDPNAQRALAEAQAARAAVDAAKQEIRDEVGQGLTENSTHDQGYTREYVRPTMRQAAITAREVRTLLASGSGLGGKPSICARDPSLAGCR